MKVSQLLSVSSYRLGLVALKTPDVRAAPWSPYWSELVLICLTQEIGERFGFGTPFPIILETAPPNLPESRSCSDINHVLKVSSQVPREP